MITLKSHKKAQVALEFVSILGFSMLVFAVFFVFTQKEKDKVIVYNNFLEVQKVAKEVSNGINVANLEGDGYSIKILIPSKINNRDYDILLENGSLTVVQDDNSYAVTIFAETVTGSIKKGVNIIKNVGGGINIE